MSKNLVPLSKFLAVLLRHEPEEFDLKLDSQGFTPLDPVWQALHQKFGERYQPSDLLAVVEGDERGKKRYEIQNGQIRAMYGHSKPEIDYAPIVPPEILYHGTNANALESIRQTGLQAMSRQYVHLTTNRDNALVVAKRRTPQPIILHIRALDAHQAGIVFYQAEAEHYLVKNLAPDFIDFS